MRRLKLISILVAAGTLFAQTTTDVLTQTNFSAQIPVPGRGLLGIYVQGLPPQFSVDSAYVAYRTGVPAGPGQCDAGTGAWAADKHYFYFCVQNDAMDGFVWARVPVETTW